MLCWSCLLNAWALQTGVSEKLRLAKSWPAHEKLSMDHIMRKNYNSFPNFWSGPHVSFPLLLMTFYCKFEFPWWGSLATLFALQIGSQTLRTVQSAVLVVAAYPAAVAGEVSVTYASCFFPDLWPCGLLCFLWGRLIWGKLWNLLFKDIQFSLQFPRN